MCRKPNLQLKQHQQQYQIEIGPDGFVSTALYEYQIGQVEI